MQGRTTHTLHPGRNLLGEQLKLVRQELLTHILPRAILRLLVEVQYLSRKMVPLSPETRDGTKVGRSLVYENYAVSRRVTNVTVLGEVGYLTSDGDRTDRYAIDQHEIMYRHKQDGGRITQGSGFTQYTPSGEYRGWKFLERAWERIVMQPSAHFRVFIANLQALPLNFTRVKPRVVTVDLSRMGLSVNQAKAALRTHEYRWTYTRRTY